MKFYSRQYRGITDLINMPALINLDFADVQTVISKQSPRYRYQVRAKGDEALKLYSRLYPTVA